jgi:predicted transposase YbfD/YdcC
MHQAEITLVQYFDDIEDFRLDRNKKHLLVDVIVLVICCVICGANGFVEIEMVANAKIDWFRTFLKLPNGIQSHDTFGRIFRMLRPDVLEERFLAWVQTAFPDRPVQQIALDGKQSRRTADPSSDMPALQMISAWAVETGIVLGQLAVDPKSNEITALPALIETLEVEGCDIIADAFHCQKQTVKTIINHKAHYTLAVKANQEYLYADIVATFAHLREHIDQSLQSYRGCINKLLDRQRFSRVQISERAFRSLIKTAAYANKFIHLCQFQSYRTCEKGHGRLKTRQYWVTDRLDNLRTVDAWSGLQSIGMVESERVINGKVEQETRYYISSREPNAHDFGTRVRGHWSIENSLHWVLDVVMREDESRIRKDHSAENMTVVRYIAINLLKQEKTLKVGTQAKRLRAACDNDYLGKIIQLDVSKSRK